MLVRSVVRVLVLTAAMLLESGAEAATAAAVKFCGRQLSEIMSRVCHAYNGPSWDTPTVVEQPGAARRRRHAGIADECCAVGCTWDQLSEYCSVSALAQPLLQSTESHTIAGRSAERRAALPARAAGLTKSVVRAAPVVGTVSPLLTWGRTLNNELPSPTQQNYAYVIYT